MICQIKKFIIIFLSPYRKFADRPSDPYYLSQIWMYLDIF
jgi:hypothetical protein